MPFRFESLKIWHMARAYASKIYAATTKFPRKEDYGLASQMNRAIYPSSTGYCLLWTISHQPSAVYFLRLVERSIRV